ncbi:MAG: metallophosphoesterase [Desulfurivibrionaceae bacterium]
MKIIHLSDTHIGLQGMEARFELIIDDLTRQRPLNPGSHVIVHTGDLIHRANADNRKAAQALLDRLRDFGYPVLLCPGNHDYGDSLSVGAKAADDFQAAFGEYLFQDGKEGFPSLYLRGDSAFIGLDSNAAELHGPSRLLAEGFLGVAQLSRLNVLLDSDQLLGKKIVILLHHHPFSFGYSVSPDVGDGSLFFNLFAGLTRPFRRLKDAHSFVRLVRDRARVLLFGHMHHGLDCSGEAMKYGIPLALDGGSSTCAEAGEDRMRYRIIDSGSMTRETRFLPLP